MKCLATALFVLGGLLLSGGWAASSPRLGVAVVKADTTACVTFRGDAFRVGDRVLIFLSSPPRVVDGVIRQANPEACSPNAGLEGQGYQIALRYSIVTLDEIGVAVYDPTARVEYLDGEFVVGTKGAEAPLQLRQCTSQEGLHLTAWRGNRRTWHEYYYLGYDVEPTCADEETKE